MLGETSCPRSLTLHDTAYAKCRKGVRSSAHVPTIHRMATIATSRRARLHRTADRNRGAEIESPRRAQALDSSVVAGQWLMRQGIYRARLLIEIPRLVTSSIVLPSSR